MGRVDDAMRRLAGQLAKPPAAEVEPTEHPVRLSHEPFPIELRPREASLPPVAQPVDSEPAPSSAPVKPRGSQLLSTLDAGLTGRLVIDQTMTPGSREQYRRLAATLHHAQAASGLKVVMIASAVAAEGKTLTAANLALTFSESYHRSVFLIDADLRRPSMHTIFKLESIPGLSDGLMATDQRKMIVHQVSDRLTVLPAGKPSHDPMAALISGRMRQLIEEARETFDWVIIDTPPVGIMTDANLLASMADGTLLVVKANATSYQLVQRAIDAIGRERVLGAVLNRAVLDGFHRYNYYNYYYDRGQAPAGPQ